MVDTARREIFEETQIKVSEPISSLPPVYVRENNIIWEVYPFLFDAGEQRPILNGENTEYRLVTPDEMKGLDLVDLTIEMVSNLTR